MLNPDSAVLLSDALQPPPDFRIDTAVATTYSLNLTAMLVAPMTFALGDIDDARALDSGDPVQILDAVQQHVERTTVFCQAAAIHVPTSHSRIHAFLEDSIFQVEPIKENALFHPKLWALRYIRDSDDSLHHRVVIGSKNLTLDSSWDTVLVLDECSEGTIAASPAADFVSQLPAFCTYPLPEVRIEAINSLASTMHSVRLEPPHPFTGGDLLPLGLSVDDAWPFITKSKRTLAITPFVTAGTLSRLRSTTSDATLLSRPAALDQIGTRGTSGWDLQVLSSGTDLVDRSGDESTIIDEFTSVPADDTEPTSSGELSGLHAKTVITDFLDGHSSVVTGSANITAAAWERNIEFNAILTGPTSMCGVDVVLAGSSSGGGLQMIMEPYTPGSEFPSDDPAIAASYQLESFHRDLIRAHPRPRLDVIPRDDASATVRLTLTLPDDLHGDTSIWLSTVSSQRRALAEVTTWDIAVENITPFIAVESHKDVNGSRITRRCLLKVNVVGDPQERRRRALADILNSSERVLSYLVLLLGIEETPRASSLVGAQPDASVVKGEYRTIDAATSAAPPPVVLFEPLVRAVGNDLNELASVADRIRELRDVPEVEARIPADFLQMWDVVLTVIAERQGR